MTAPEPDDSPVQAPTGGNLKDTVDNTVKDTTDGVKDTIDGATGGGGTSSGGGTVDNTLTYAEA